MNHLENKQQIEAGGKIVTIYPCEKENSPVVYLNTISENGDKEYRMLKERNCPDFTLVTISGLVWNHDMTPWECPSVLKFDEPYSGGADEYLKLLEDKIIPAAEALIPRGISWRGLAGYSLAGLFAVYAFYKTDLFSRTASVSGSLWYPGLMDFARLNPMKKLPTHAYFSVGDKESHTKNQYLKSVQENTEALKELYENAGIETIFELNQGNHFKDFEERTVKGIAWILSR